MEVNQGINLFFDFGFLFEERGEELLAFGEAFAPLVDEFLKGVFREDKGLELFFEHAFQILFGDFVFTGGTDVFGIV